MWHWDTSTDLRKWGERPCVTVGRRLSILFRKQIDKKSVTIVELLEKGNVRVSTVPLIPRRDMRKLRGTYMDVTAKDHYTAENKMDYLQITLTDEEDVAGGTPEAAYCLSQSDASGI